jgi:hypothetical protein
VEVVVINELIFVVIIDIAAGPIRDPGTIDISFEVIVLAVILKICVYRYIGIMV